MGLADLVHASKRGVRTALPILGQDTGLRLDRLVIGAPLVSMFLVIASCVSMRDTEYGTVCLTHQRSQKPRWGIVERNFQKVRKIFLETKKEIGSKSLFEFQSIKRKLQVKILSFLVISTVILAACTADPQKALERRTALIENVFPSLGDRQGVYLVFPWEAGGYIPTLEVMFFTKDVGETEIRRRVGAFCARQGNPSFTGRASINKDLGFGTRTTSSGTTKQTRQILYRCDTAG
ncbi:hypothetical protein [Roseobacter sp.]|uniref:hypothetical protein n=1 Tax=Roseobacter sp. TaxID=1907202 RepID=UPI0032983B6D